MKDIEIDSYQTAREDYKAYGLYVNSGRALANDVDGMKRVYRRTLWASLQHPKGKKIKSAVLVGDCLVGDTKIPLLNGDIVTMKELYESKSRDDEFWVYSIDSTGNPVPGKASNIHKSRLEADLVKIRLSNGEELICTPDHLILVRDGSYVKAKNLKKDESLMPIYKKINSNKDYFRTDREREIIWFNNGEHWLPTHLMVSRYLNGVASEGMATHHKDHNILNNDPSNLELMTHLEHLKYHGKFNKGNLIKAGDESRRLLREDVEYRKVFVQKCSERNHKYKEKYDEFRLKGKKALKIARELNPEKFKTIQTKNSRIGWETKKSNEDYMNKHREKARETLIDNRYLLEKSKTTKGLNRMINLVDFELSVSNFEEVRVIYKDKYKKGAPRLSTSLKYFSNFEEMVEVAKNYNLYVIDVENLKYKEDVYDISVEKHHNFLTNSGVVVHNCMKYNPHGAQSGVLYSLVNSRLQMFDKQGNFGSKLIAGAADRYTECCLNKVADLYLGQDLVNYCEMVEGEIGYAEPKFLSALIPFILVDGNTSMGVGVASSIPSLDVIDLIDFYKAGLTKETNLEVKLDLGECKINASSAEVSNLVLKGQINGFRYHPIVELEGKSLIIKDIPPGMNLSKIMKIFEVAIEKEVVDFRDESNSELRLVFDVIKGNAKEYKEKVEGLSSTVYYDLTFAGSYEQEEKIVYTELKLIRERTLKYLKECAIRKFTNEVTNLKRKLNVLLVIKYMKENGIVELLPKLLKEEIIKLLPFELEYVNQALQQSISNLMKGANDNDIKELEDKITSRESDLKDPNNYLISLYDDFKSEVKKFYINKTKYK